TKNRTARCLGRSYSEVVSRELAMATVPKQSAAQVPPPKPEAGKIPGIATASVPDTLAALQVNPETGLTQAEVDARRKQLSDLLSEHGAQSTHVAMACPPI